MFPDDHENHDIPEAPGYVECSGCGGFHGDLMEPFSAWLVDLTKGRSSLSQLMSVVRSLIVNLRMSYTPEQINYLFAVQVADVEARLRDNGYDVIDHETKESKPLPTIEKQMEIDELAQQMGDTIPEWMLKEEEE